MDNTTRVKGRKGKEHIHFNDILFYIRARHNLKFCYKLFGMSVVKCHKASELYPCHRNK